MFADLKFALRQLAQAPGFALIAVLTLAIGIATATTMFTFFNALLIRPMPFLRDEAALLNVRTVNAGDPGHDFEFSIPDFNDVRAQAKTLAGALIVTDRTYILGGGERPARVLGAWITADGFQTLGVQPTLGRLFRADEGSGDGAPVAILSYNLWQQSFGGRADLVGQTITLNTVAVTVVGIMPDGFRFPELCDVWQPFPVSDRAQEKDRGNHAVPLYARLQPGVTLAQAQAELDTIAARLAAAHPATNTGIRYRALTIRDEATRDLRLALQLLLGAVLAVLLIACGNVANLLLARASGRSREIAVRAALGAGRARLIRQMLTESLLLGFAGGLAGLVFTSWELDFVLSFIPVEIPFWIRFDLDWHVLLFATVATVGASLLFGVFPALQISRPDLVHELKDGARGGTGSGRALRMRSALVVGQMALALVLLVVAGLLMRSFLNLQRTDTGIDSAHVLTFRTGLPPAMVKDARIAPDFFEKVAMQLRALPGVENAGFMNLLPVSQSRDTGSFLFDGAPEPKSSKDWPRALHRTASPDVFAAFHIPLLQGRLFDERDLADAPRVAVVDRDFVRKYFPHSDAIGQRLTYDEAGPKRKWITIVGVVGNVRQRPADPAELPAIWQPFAQDPDNFATAVVRVAGNPTAYTRPAEDAVLAVRSDIPIYYAQPMTEVVSKTLWKQRFFGGLFASFAGIALFLAAIGIYGVMSYNVSQRTQEIGVRMALGAPSGAVVAMILRQGVRLIALGLAVGFAGAWIAATALASLLHGIEPHDPPTFALVPLLLATVALLACYLPSRRATRIDPIIALRAE